MGGRHPSPIPLTFEELKRRGDRAAAEWKRVLHGAHRAIAEAQALRREIDETHHRAKMGGTQALAIFEH